MPPPPAEQLRQIQAAPNNPPPPPAEEVARLPRPSVARPPETPMNIRQPTEADLRAARLYHNFIINSEYIFVPQLQACVRYGGTLLLVNAYNNAHFRNSPIYHCTIINLVDTKKYGYAEVAADAVANVLGHDGKTIHAMKDLIAGPANLLIVPNLNKAKQLAVYRSKGYCGGANAVPDMTDTEAWMEEEAHMVALRRRLRGDTSASISVKPFNIPHTKPSLLANNTPLRRYGMPINSNIFEMVNCNSQPLMRFGHQLVVHRTCVYVLGGLLSYDEFADKPLSCWRFDWGRRTWTDLANLKWKPRSATGDDDGEAGGDTTPEEPRASGTFVGTSLLRPAYCQASRHTAADEVVCFSWGGYDLNARGVVQEGTLQKALNTKNTKLRIGWFFPPTVEAPRLSLYRDATTTGTSEYNEVDAPYHYETLALHPDSPAPEWEQGRVLFGVRMRLGMRVLDREPISRGLPDIESAGGYLVTENRMPPPPFAVYKRAREAYRNGTLTKETCGKYGNLVFDVLYLFTGKGPVWRMKLSLHAMVTGGLMWEQVNPHFALPLRCLEPVTPASSDAEPVFRARETPEVAEELERCRDHVIVGVIPRSRFSRYLIPEDLYPTIDELPSSPQSGTSAGPPMSGAKPMGLGAAMNPMAGFAMGGMMGLNPQMMPSHMLGMGMGMMGPPASSGPLLSGPLLGPSPIRVTKVRQLQAATEFVIVTQRVTMVFIDHKGVRTATDVDPIPNTTTFIPSLGHSVNERYRVRMPANVRIHSTSTITPHFIRPLPTTDVEMPQSDSRRVDPANIATTATTTPTSLTAKHNAAADGTVYMAEYAKKLPPPRTFGAIVNGARMEGNSPEHGEPVSTYITRSPMTLKELVAQVALRFFTAEELSAMTKPSELAECKCPSPPLPPSQLV